MSTRIERDLSRLRAMLAHRRAVLADQLERLSDKARGDVDSLAAGAKAWLSYGNYGEFAGRIDAAAAEVYQMERQIELLEDIKANPEG